MSVDIRLPNIEAKTEAEKQIKSYLIQMVEQLNWALQNIDTSNNTVVVNPTPKSLLSSSQNTSNLASPEATFGSIKALIIKSADIVNAYYDVINNRLSSGYVAQSDFGIYLQQNSQSITQTSTSIEQLFSSLQGIITDIDNIDFTIADVTAHIKSGKLYEDDNGLPVYGLEIGQKNRIDGEENFIKFARFTSDRLSFYDQNDAEVAYVSDYKLYIRNVEIKESFKEGGYKDFIDSNGGIVTKWVGGN